MSETDIFLSYARQDRPTARTFADSLIGEGFTVWWDASLHSGETFDEVIEHNLREAKAVVVLWSPRSVASRWVRAEATLADRRRKLVPAIIEACDRPIVFELTHTADLSHWNGDATDAHWRAFVDDLKRLLHSADGRDRAQPAPVRTPPSAAMPATVSPTSRPQPPRQPLRPGSEQVIAADGLQRDAAVHRLPANEATTDDSAQSEVHCLEVEASDLPSDLIVVESSSIKLGRSAPADFILSDKSISREHCIIGLANDELLVTDLNSTNGTYVDDARIRRATILPVGSLLRLGRISLRHAVHTRAEAERRRGLSMGNRPGDLPAESLAASS